MKTLFLTVAATALIFAAPAAFAQDDHHGHPGGEHHGGPPPATHTAPAAPTHAAPTHTTPPAMTMSHSTGHEHHGAAMTAPLTPSNSPYANGRMDHKGHTNRNNSNANRNGANRNAPNFNNNGRFNNNGHRGRGGNGSHVTINFNRHNVTASHHFHYRGGAYRGPSGYSYHRYSYGDYLPSIYFAQNYWISDYSYYGLAYPPDGAVWVRYGDDAVLIDEDSGEILEVVYGQFY